MTMNCILSIIISIEASTKVHYNISQYELLSRKYPLRLLLQSQSHSIASQSAVCPFSLVSRSSLQRPLYLSFSFSMLLCFSLSSFAIKSLLPSFSVFTFWVDKGYISNTQKTSREEYDLIIYN